MFYPRQATTNIIYVYELMLVYINLLANTRIVEFFASSEFEISRS